MKVNVKPLVETKSINNTEQYFNNRNSGAKMVLYGKPKSLKKSAKKRRVGRPTQFETQLEMAKISWAPVLECLSLLDSKKYRTIEELPPPEKPYNINLGKRVIEIERRNPHKIEHWITGDQIKIIHDDLIKTFGGDLGIADSTQLGALIDRAQNSSYYGHDPLKTIVHKAAFLMHGLLRYHPFIDGQKRTGVSTAFIFLGLNGYTFWSRDVLGEVRYCIDTTLGLHEVDDITKWLSDRIWVSKIAREQDTINAIIKSESFKVQCTNTKCRGIIKPISYRTKCPKCGQEYELKITNVVATHGLKPHVTYNIGLHKLEDSELITSGVISLSETKTKPT